MLFVLYPKSEWLKTENGKLKSSQVSTLHTNKNSPPFSAWLTLLCFVCRLSSETNFDPFLCFKIPKHKKFGPTFGFVFP